MNMDYRGDIDCLRAFAVMAVIVFHYFPFLAPNGFLGVDIFFVISGFLITNIVFYENGQKLGIAHFYDRRIRRIFPQLLILLSGIMVVGWFSLTDQEYLNVLKHIFATTVFSENFILAKEINYFDPDVHLKPLVHMWSLSIEEQFYLLFPLIFLFRKMWGRANLVVVGVTIISIICCIISSVYFSKYTYYISISRFWEISTGCLLAINQDKIRYNARIHLILGLAGVMFIGVCVFQKSVAQDFSIYKTLFAVLGAGLIIASGLRNNSFSSFVGNLAPMTHIGKISYSLYLYHWPILSFAYILLGQRPETMTLVVLLIATYLITLLTYYTVEKPARYTKFNVSPVLFLAMLFVLGLSVLIQKGPMLKLRGVFKPIDLYSDEIGRNAAETFKPSIFGCSNQFGALVQSQKTACYQSKPNRSPDLILVGDSHAGELYGGFSNSYRANNIALVSFYRTHEDEITDAIVKTKGVRSVVFAFYWLDKLAPNPVGERFGIVLRDSINRIVRSGISVYVIDDVPTFSFLPSACKSLRFVFKRNICSESSDLFVKERSCYSKYLSDLENDFKNVKLINTSKYVCDSHNCKMTANGHILFLDTNHLNEYGAQFIVSKISSEYNLLK